MDITHIPQRILSNNQESKDPIIFRTFIAEQGVTKSKGILHKHAISLVISGEKKIYFGDTTVKITDKEFHFLSAGKCISTMKLSEEKIFKSILVFFDASVLADFKIKYRHLISGVNTAVKKEAYVSFRKDAFIENFILSVQTFLHLSNNLSAEMKLVKFEELMLYLLEQYPEKILSFDLEKNDREIEIRTAVETNIANNITVDELAYLCNMSSSTFKRRFNELYGMPPQKWMLLRRMEMAKELLFHHQERPGEVYHKVGYESHSSFSQSFKKLFGITPTEYSQQLVNF